MVDPRSNLSKRAAYAALFYRPLFRIKTSRHTAGVGITAQTPALAELKGAQGRTGTAPMHPAFAHGRTGHASHGLLHIHDALRRRRLQCRMLKIGRVSVLPAVAIARRSRHGKSHHHDQ
jgi:hypothetical protein